MRSIERTECRDICATLPEFETYDGQMLSEESFTLLVCAGGFEDRASAIAGTVAAQSLDGLIVIEYPTNRTENEDALSRLRALCAEDRTVTVEYDRRTFRRVMRAALAKYGEEDSVRVVVDMSGMASYVLFRVFSVLWDHMPTARLCVFYAEAGEYFPSETEWVDFRTAVRESEGVGLLELANAFEESKFQSLGISCLYEMEEFPGSNVGGLATRAVVVPNFSRERIKTMLSRAEMHYGVRPRDCVWVLGEPPDERKNGWRLRALGELYQVAPRDNIPVSTRLYKDMLRALEKQWVDCHLQRHLVVATLGSKMQHLGTFLFLKMHAEVGLIISEPSRFIAERFSKDVGPVWWGDFGCIEELRKRVGEYGTLRYCWGD